ncbi:HD domain-containing protein [Dyadobacter aurulentus]|uniref:HD domain-containing protein n=1 Tax=Dyadobacter sp. UC 10 TaxID=2605428 RepID=UPI0011F272E6|nr:HD domain-containing protein [Dyadobacter sp. UC 10]KAA0993183.1 HD domain-containing protein [Dyadobacter sp. UC 10]
MDLEKAREFILEELRIRLEPDLYYHGLHHTRDVVQAAMEIADLEKITDRESLQMLETAALYHDSGFMNVYKGHEEEGCRIAREVLRDFDYSNTQIETICGMILATKVPQNPRNHLERIICDADLDYLGRSDFHAVSATLFEELKAREMITEKAEWNRIQVSFFESHFYWNKSQRERRDDLKAAHLASIRRILSDN